MDWQGIRANEGSEEGMSEPKIIRARKIPIKPSRTYQKFARRESYPGMFAWTKAPAFAVNPRGVLVHRVRHVTTYLRDGKDSHYHVDYLCGNGCNVELRTIVDVLVTDPPRDRLLCEHCEMRARMQELPSGDHLAGRHVHRGVLVPRQTCCLAASPPRTRSPPRRFVTRRRSEDGE